MLTATEYLRKCARIFRYASNESFNNEELIKKNTAVSDLSRLPCLSDHTEKKTIFKLLNAEENIGVTLTESLAMFPASSVSGWYFAHPDSKYFGLGKIKKDQVIDLAKRKAVDESIMLKWLALIWTINFDFKRVFIWDTHFIITSHVLINPLRHPLFLFRL